MGKIDADQIKRTILDSAEEIVGLRTRVHKTFAQRERSPEESAEWEQARAEFHFRYDFLAFPGGLDGAYDRIVAGDPQAVEAAICFLEVRPYFLRSGYMFRDILRKCKRAPLSHEQKVRLDFVIEKLAEWKRSAEPDGGWETWPSR